MANKKPLNNSCFFKMWKVFTHLPSNLNFSDIPFLIHRV